MKRRFTLITAAVMLLTMMASTGQAWGQTVLWSENFNGLAADATPTAPTNAAYTGVTYTCTDGTGTSPGSTKIMNENLAGATKPELMVGKKGSGTGTAGGKFTVVVPLDNYEGSLTLTYYQNKQSLSVSSTTSGVSGGQTLKPSAVGQQTTTFTGITTGMTSITIVFQATTTNNVRLDDIVLSTVPVASVADPAFSPAEGTYTSTQSVTISCATDGTTIYYTTDGSTPTSSSTPYTGAISVSSTTTIKAIAKKDDNYSSVVSATYTIYPVLHAGTAGDPYTVADARNAIDANIGLTDVYVAGIVCEGGSSLADGAMNYWISDDGTETNKFEIYKGKGLSGADFTSTDDVQVGDEVVVTGTITKYSTTYEFQSGSQLFSLNHPSTPLITVTPASLTGFTYSSGSGPSTAQTISVSGSNLTTNISLSLGESNYEMSLTEGSGYTNNLTLTQAAGTVDATTVYVRLKAELAVNASYNGTITLTSTGATERTVSLAGSVTYPCFTWDLSTNSYNDPTENLVTWSHAKATMTLAKGTSGTAANNYLGGDANNRTSTRFYSNQVLTITSTAGYSITSVKFEATTESYASALQSSTWTNATAAVSSKIVTVTPTNGAVAISATIGATCGFTEVTVYYTPWNHSMAVDGEGNLTDNVVIEEGGTENITNLTIPTNYFILVEGVLNVSGTLTNNGTAANIIIADGGQLIHTNDVNATMKKNITGYGGAKGGSHWYTIASPVDGEPVSTLTTGTYDLYAYTESTHTWYNQKAHTGDFTTLSRGTGYLYANSAAKVIDFAGSMKATNAEVTVPLSYTDALPVLKGVNLVGNPFTRNLTAGEVKIDGTALTTYLAVEVGSELVVRNISTTPIKPGQGFFVQLPESHTTTNLVFNPSSKGETDTKPAFVCIEAGDANFMDRAYVQIGQGNKLNKVSINEEVSHLYLTNKGKDFAAVTIENAQGEMPVCFKAAYDGSNTISVSTVGLDLNYLHLIDKLTGIDIDLLMTPSYTFEAKKGDSENRFRLVFEANGNALVTSNEPFAYFNGSEWVIENDGNATLQVIDVMGRMLRSENVSGNATTSLPNLSAGVYVLRLVNSESIRTQKVVIE